MPAEPLRATGAFAKKVPQFQATREAENRRDPGTGVSDVTQLLTLTEETVMQNTMVRFSRDEIYTFVGSVLLAVNPYKPIPMLYGEDVMMAFESGSLVDAPPHMYALVESSYRRAIHGGGSQSLIISGESGAGKTESTKLALSYLVWRTRRQAKGDLSASASFMKCILQANPLMEAFGNVRGARAPTGRPSYTHRAGR